MKVEVVVVGLKRLSVSDIERCCESASNDDSSGGQASKSLGDNFMKPIATSSSFLRHLIFPSTLHTLALDYLVPK
jgi:predicted house-cleaning NTP pyrophosphatase (Maf/HAM1 superfamily)